MNQQFVFRLQTQEAEQKRTAQPDFKFKTTETHRYNNNTAPSVGAMYQRSTQLQVNEYEGENMSSLHAKLHQEADKIRKWKIQTEMDLKEKSKKLTAASAQIETMKKSMLELQLDNERLSSRMQEEINNREDVMLKISSTREMCNLLKSTASKLEDKVLHCETEKTELKYTGRETSQHLEELRDKFENLHLSSENNQKKIMQQVEKERNENLEKEKLWTSKCEESSARIHELEADLKEKNETVLELKAVLQEKSCALERLNESMGQLKKNNKTLQEDLQEKEEDFKESSIRILTLQDEKHIVEERLKDCEAEIRFLEDTKDKISQQMTKSCSKYEADLVSAQENIIKLEKKLVDEQTNVKNYQTELQEVLTEVEKLKSSRDILTLEKTEFEVKFDLQNYEITNLTTHVAENKEEINRLNTDIDVLLKKLEQGNVYKIQLENAGKEMHAEINSLNLEKEEQLKTILDLEKALETKQNEVKNILSKESEQTEILQTDILSKEKELEDERTRIKELQESLSQAQETILGKESDLSSKTEAIEKLEEDMQEQKSLLVKCQKELDQDKSHLEELKNDYEEEKKKSDNLSNHLKDISLENKEHGKSLTSQQKKFATLTKHNKELEKEVKSLKANFNTELKKTVEKENTIKSMKEEIEELKQTNEGLNHSKIELEKDMEALKEDCNRSKKASEEAIAKAKEMQEMAKKEKENAKAVTECQLAEMMGTLDTYKQSCEKIFSDKEAEIRTLKNKLETIDVKNLSEKDELRGENKQLSSNVNLLSKEKEDLQQQLTVKDNENQFLKDKIQDLETQMKSVGKIHFDDFSKSPNLSLDSRKPQLSQQVPPVAPVTPQKQIPWTPKTPKTPLQVNDGQNVLKTPQRSILRASSSMSKRRKVAFMSDDQDVPSSSDDLMELEVETEDNRPLDKCLTPRSRTPKVSSVPDSVSRMTPNSVSRMTPKRTPNLTPINKALYTSTPIQKNPETQNATGLSTGSDSLRHAEPKLQKSEGQKTPNIRNVPPKKTSKFFTTSPKEKTRIKDKTKVKKTEQLSWFDLDSVYGFGPED